MDSKYLYFGMATSIYILLSVIWCSNFFSFQNLSGHCMTEGDPALNAWVLAWVTRAMTSDPMNLYNGNTFFPHLGSITFAEPLVSLAILNIPVQLFFSDPWTGYNLLIFQAYVLSAVGGYLLVQWLTKSTAAAFWGGLFWGFLFYRVHHIGHLQILSIQWFPFLLLYLFKLRSLPSTRNAILFVMFFVFQALVSWYLAVIAGILSVIAFLFLLPSDKWTNKHFVSFGFAALSIVLLVAPFAVPYVSAIQQTSLSVRIESSFNSTDKVAIRDFFYPPSATAIGHLMPDNKYWIWEENTLYIGFVPVLIVLTSTFFSLFRKLKIARGISINASRLGMKKEYKYLATALVIVGFVLALGCNSAWFGGIKLPLHYLAEAFPFLGAMRATQRFSILIYIGILILSGYGVAKMSESIQRRTVRLTVPVFLGLAFLLEVYPYNLPIRAQGRYQPSKIDREIATLQRVNFTKYNVLHYPIHYFSQSYPVGENVYMLDSTFHWANIVNGFSGSEPLGFKDEMAIYDLVPDQRAVALMKKNNINLLAIHESMSEERREKIEKFFVDTLSAKILFRDAGALLMMIK